MSMPTPCTPAIPATPSWQIAAWKDLSTLVLFLGGCAMMGVFGYAPVLAPLAQDPRFSLMVMVILGSCLAFKVMEGTVISMAGQQGVPRRHQSLWSPLRVVILGALLLPLGEHGSTLGQLAAQAMRWAA